MIFRMRHALAWLMLINNNIFQKFFFSSKNLKQNHEIIYNDPFTIDLHHFVDDNADAWHGAVCSWDPSNFAKRSG